MSTLTPPTTSAATATAATTTLRGFLRGWARGDAARVEVVELMYLQADPAASPARVAALCGLSTRTVERWLGEFLAALQDAASAEGWGPDDLVVRRRESEENEA